MKKLTLFCLVAFVTLIYVSSCSNKEKKSDTANYLVEEESNDSTLYGVCGPNTSMHSLELIIGKGDTLTLSIDEDKTDDSTKIYNRNIVLGGLLTGDAMAVTAYRNDDGVMCVNTIINLKTLEGKWTNPDMINSLLEIVEDGTIVSTANIEKTPYTEWHIHNGLLIMSNDTFTINTLGADNLEIESSKGVYLYKRLK